MEATVVTRFISKVDATGECWLWIGGCFKEGYGRFTLDGHLVLAHRIAYELWVGPIPNGLQLDHICHNNDATCAGGSACIHRRCVNPAHLDPVTSRENVLRSTVSTASRNARKTHCPYGHPLDGVQKNGGRTASNRARYCKTCLRDRSREAV